MKVTYLKEYDSRIGLIVHPSELMEGEHGKMIEWSHCEYRWYVKILNGDLMYKETLNAYKWGLGWGKKDLHTVLLRDTVRHTLRIIITEPIA